MPETKFDFNLVGIASTLETRRLAVPIYQRSYAWGSEDPKERDQVKEFWEDLRGTFVKVDDEYFLGTLVLSKEGPNNRISVIDGQQRLATTAILIAAVRDVFKERGDENRARIIHEKFLAKADLDTAGHQPQLVLNADDDPFFSKFIIDGKLDTDRRTQSHKLIARAYEGLREYVVATAEDAAGTWAERLKEWVMFLAERARVMVVEVPTEADAFLIFETLNDRGADLTIADLLKNYLFGRAETQLEPVRNAWITSLANLDISAAGGQLFTDFLRHFWSSKYGATRERELYARIKETIMSSASALELALELQNASRLYAAILRGDHEFWSEHGTAVRTNIDVLGALNLEQNRPLLLAAMQHLTKAELIQTLHGLVSWSVRGLVVGGIGGGTAERLYCEAAMKVRKGDAKTAEEIRKALATIVHGDRDFRAAFANATVTRSPIARYMLAALERTKKGLREPELVPNEDAEKVNLEHVLPRNASASDWPQFTDEERARYLHRLGNLALLSKGPNDKIGNEPFSVKKPILQKSELELTKEIGGQQDWTPKAMAERQERLATLAVTTVPLIAHPPAKRASARKAAVKKKAARRKAF